MKNGVVRYQDAPPNEPYCCAKKIGIFRTVGQIAVAAAVIAVVVVREAGFAVERTIVLVVPELPVRR